MTTHISSIFVQDMGSSAIRILPPTDSGPPMSDISITTARLRCHPPPAHFRTSSCLVGCTLRISRPHASQRRLGRALVGLCRLWGSWGPVGQPISGHLYLCSLPCLASQGWQLYIQPRMRSVLITMLNVTVCEDQTAPSPYVSEAPPPRLYTVIGKIWGSQVCTAQPYAEEYDANTGGCTCMRSARGRHQIDPRATMANGSAPYPVINVHYRHAANPGKWMGPCTSPVFTHLLSHPSSPASQSRCVCGLEQLRSMIPRYAGCMLHVESRSKTYLSIRWKQRRDPTGRSEHHGTAI